MECKAIAGLAGKVEIVSGLYRAASVFAKVFVQQRLKRVLYQFCILLSSLQKQVEKAKHHSIILWLAAAGIVQLQYYAKAVVARCIGRSYRYFCAGLRC